MKFTAAVLLLVDAATVASQNRENENRQSIIDSLEPCDDEIAAASVPAEWTLNDDWDDEWQWEWYQLSPTDYAYQQATGTIAPFLADKGIPVHEGGLSTWYEPDIHFMTEEWYSLGYLGDGAEGYDTGPNHVGYWDRSFNGVWDVLGSNYLWYDTPSPTSNTYQIEWYWNAYSNEWPYMPDIDDDEITSVVNRPVIPEDWLFAMYGPIGVEHGGYGFYGWYEWDDDFLVDDGTDDWWGDDDTGMFPPGTSDTFDDEWWGKVDGIPTKTTHFGEKGIFYYVTEGKSPFFTYAHYTVAGFYTDLDEFETDWWTDAEPEGSPQYAGDWYHTFYWFYESSGYVSSYGFYAGWYGFFYTSPEEPLSLTTKEEWVSTHDDDCIHWDRSPHSASLMQKTGESMRRD